jgi:hypothetical protein
MAENGHCIICGKPIMPKEDGQGSCMVVKLELHHPVYPQLKTTYEGRWCHHTCAENIAHNVCENDSLF